MWQMKHAAARECLHVVLNFKETLKLFNICRLGNKSGDYDWERNIYHCAISQSLMFFLRFIFLLNFLFCFGRYSWLSFPGGSDGKEFACNAGDLGSITGLGRSPGGGHGNPLQYSCLENPHGQRSLAGYVPWGCKESDTTKRLGT